GQNGALNLSITGVDTGSPSSSLNLAIEGGNAEASGGFPMFVRSEPPTYDVIPLTLQGPAGSSGFLPVEGSLNLHVERRPQAGFTMFLQQSGQEATLGMCITGRPWDQDQVDLFIGGDGGSPNAQVAFAIPVMSDWSPLNSDLHLSIPKAVGFEEKPVTL